PIFTLLRQVGLPDTVWGLLPPYLAFGLPFEVLILTAFFKRIPQEVIESARIDGASELKIFVRIVLPLSLPVLITVAILDAVATWNELVMALVLLSSPGHRTVPLALLNFQGQFTTNFPALCAVNWSRSVAASGTSMPRQARRDSGTAARRSRRATPSGVRPTRTRRSSLASRDRVTYPMAVSRFSSGVSVPLSRCSRSPSSPTDCGESGSSQSTSMVMYWG